MGHHTEPTPTERATLLALQVQALRYFLDNQTATGLIRDRQANHGPLRAGGTVSTSATGMGLIALALASAPPYRLLSGSDAAERVRRALEISLTIPHTRGVLPHFLDARTLSVVGHDARSTIDTAWLVVGGLWAADFLRDPVLISLAEALSDRVDWHYWCGADTPAFRGLIRHGHTADGDWLTCSWDRLNGETVLLYLLAAGAGAENRAWPANNWPTLGRFDATAGGRTFPSGDLGLFVFQYGLDLLDASVWREPGGRDLVAEAVTAAVANRTACREQAETFGTYRRFWGLSAGDGPSGYEAYAPNGPIDGTAHLTATIASLDADPSGVWENLGEAFSAWDLPVQGRYGFSSVNVDRGWTSRDVVGIDLGAVVLALDNVLADHRVRRGFHKLPSVQLGLARTGWTLPRVPKAA